MSAEGRLLTPADLAGRWRCSSDWVYQEIHAGRIVASWLGGWRITEEEAQRVEKANTHIPAVRRKPGPKRKPRHLTKGM